MSIKLITFDLDDTIWDVTPVLLAAQKATAHWVSQQDSRASQAYNDQDLMLKLYSQVREENPELVNDLGAIRKKTILKLFLSVGLSRSRAQELADGAFAVFYAMRQKCIPYSDVDSVLKRISSTSNTPNDQSRVLATISNGNADVSRMPIGQYFSFNLNVKTSNGYVKPNPHIFELALQRASEVLGCTVSAQDAVHIGDSPTLDVKAALNCHWNAVWYNANNQQTWPDNLDIEESELILMTNWSELPQLLAQNF